MIELVKNLFDQILFVSIPEERSLKYEDFKILAVDANVINYSYCEDPSSYIIKFINDKKNKDNVLAFCGSIYVMGHIKKKLNEL
jgi:folylpolyglutamate synthase/dihydropteroate synthase